MGGVHAYVTVDQPAYMHRIDSEEDPPPAVPIVKVHERASIELRMDKSCSFQKTNAQGRVMPIPIPDRVVQAFLRNPDSKAPAIQGLLTHPVVMPDGRYLSEDGLDPDTGIYLHGGGAVFDPIPELVTREMAAEYLNEIRNLLLCDFEFAGGTEAERANQNDAAVSLLLTALQRKVMDMAPAYLIGAGVQGSGKTTLVRIIHVILTGQDMPVSQLSPDRNEVKKEILSLLLEQVPLVCFDNMEDGSVISHPVISAVLTASRYKGRVLGVSKDATVPTNATFVFTGNTLSVDRDLASRVLPIQLDVRTGRPDRRTFTHPDVVRQALMNRRRVVWLANCLVAGYLRAGVNVVPEASRFVNWDRMVRGPILWAGGSDPALRFEQSHADSPDVAAHEAIVTGLHEVFGSDDFTVSDIVRRLDSNIEPYRSSRTRELHDTIEEYREGGSKSTKSMGWLLKQFVDRPTRDGRYRLRKSGDKARRPRYQVVLNIESPTMMPPPFPPPGY